MQMPDGGIAETNSSFELSAGSTVTLAVYLDGTPSGNYTYQVAPSDIIEVTKASDGALNIKYLKDGTATISITYSGTTAEYVCNAGNVSGGSGGNGDTTPGLKYRYANYDESQNRHVEVKTNPLLTSITEEMNPLGGFPTTFYLVDEKGQVKNLRASDLTIANGDIVTLSPDKDNDLISHVQVTNIGKTTISYGNYTMDVTVNQPEVGFYSGTTADPSEIIFSHTVTSSSNKFYLVPIHGHAISDVQFLDEFGKFATCEIASDGSYATITVNGTFESGYVYNVEVVTAVSDNEYWRFGRAIELVDGKEENHTLMAVPEVGATHSADGTKAHWFCTTCEKTFSDKDGTVEVAAEDLVIPKLIQIKNESATVTEGAITEAIESAKDKDTVELPLATLDKNVTTAEIPTAALANVAEAEKSLVIETKNASVTLDAAAIETIVNQAGAVETIQLVLDVIKDEQLNEKQQATVKGLEIAMVLSAEILCNDKNISDFKGGVVTVQIKFEPEPGTKGRNYKLIHIGDDGKIEEIDASYKDGHMVANLKHFSEYAIVKKNLPEMTFTDVYEDDWYFDEIKYVYSLGLMNGVGNNAFDPTGTMSRGMLVTVLHRLEGSPEAGSCSFTDLTAGWYKEAVAWAAEVGIAKGVSDTKFEPDEPVTREQMAVFIHRYAKYKGVDVSGLADISSFPDSAEVSSWAKTEMQWSVKAGLIIGTLEQGSKLLAPQDSATRAEAATILMRYLENFDQ